MSPQQLCQLREFSELFEHGKVTHEQIDQLRSFLSTLNRHQNSNGLRTHMMENRCFLNRFNKVV